MGSKKIVANEGKPEILPDYLLSKYKVSGQKSTPLDHCMLPKKGFTELNTLTSFNSLKMPIPRYGFTSKFFTSPLLNVSRRVKFWAVFTLVTLGFI